MIEVRVPYGFAKHPSVQQSLSRLISQSTFAKPTYRQGVDAMFFGLHAGRQTCLVIGSGDGHARLDDRRTAIELFGHEMHRRAMLCLARLEGTSMCVQAWEFRQQ